MFTMKRLLMRHVHTPREKTHSVKLFLHCLRAGAGASPSEETESTRSRSARVDPRRPASLGAGTGVSSRFGVPSVGVGCGGTLDKSTQARREEKSVKGGGTRWVWERARRGPLGAPRR